MAAAVVGLTRESAGGFPDISSGLNWRTLGPDLDKSRPGGGPLPVMPFFDVLEPERLVLPLLSSDNELLNPLTALSSSWPELLSLSMMSAGSLSINFVDGKGLVQVAAYFGMKTLR